MSGDPSACGACLDAVSSGGAYCETHGVVDVDEPALWVGSVESFNDPGDLADDYVEPAPLSTRSAASMDIDLVKGLRGEMARNLEIVGLLRGRIAEIEGAPVVHLDSPAGFPVEGTQTAQPSALEAAWAEADRLRAARQAARDEADRLDPLFRSAYERAEALGPRPTVNATTNNGEKR